MSQNGSKLAKTGKNPTKKNSPVRTRSKAGNSTKNQENPSQATTTLKNPRKLKQKRKAIQATSKATEKASVNPAPETGSKIHKPMRDSGKVTVKNDFKYDLIASS